MTVVKGAVADYSDEQRHAGLDINIPNAASAGVATSEIVNSIVAQGRALSFVRALSAKVAVDVGCDVIAGMRKEASR